MKVALFVLMCFICCGSVEGLPKLTVSIKGEIPVKGLIFQSDGQSVPSAVLNSFKDQLNNIELKLGQLTKKGGQNKTSSEGQKDGYQGCYKDDAARLLKHKISEVGSNASLAYCRKHCDGYKYVGLQAGLFCLCGNKLHNKAYPKVDDSECSMDCRGEPRRKCGSDYRNSIYLV